MLFAHDECGFSRFAQPNARSWAMEGEIVAVLGGTHLVSADDDMLAQAVDALREDYGSPMLYVSHCTGQKATAALAAAFGDRVQPCPAGTTLTF